MDRLGFDGVGFNEHHCSPYWLLNSPNRMAAAAAQRTSRLKLLIWQPTTAASACGSLKNLQSPVTGGSCSRQLHSR
jgi:alkanesulfonate monooxygenase SsuD/methylene tetrahydromethanopterin reductase-like flavin-dependent oxidoreductase (luciferase family)